MNSERQFSLTFAVLSLFSVHNSDMLSSSRQNKFCPLKGEGVSRAPRPCPRVP